MGAGEQGRNGQRRFRIEFGMTSRAGMAGRGRGGEEPGPFLFAPVVDPGLPVVI